MGNKNNGPQDQVFNLKLTVLNSFTFKNESNTQIGFKCVVRKCVYEQNELSTLLSKFRFYIIFIRFPVKIDAEKLLASN